MTGPGPTILIVEDEPEIRQFLRATFGVEVIRRIRQWSPMPIIVLSARAQERSKIEALDAGADDYVTKPFGVGELLARVRAALRHAVRAGSGASLLRFGNAVVDLEKRAATRGEQEVHLTPIEFRLLATLAKHLGMVVTHRQLLTEVWGPTHDGIRITCAST